MSQPVPIVKSNDINQNHSSFNGLNDCQNSFQPFSPPKSETSKHIHTSSCVRESSKSLANLSLIWTEPPTTVFVAKKYREPHISQKTRGLLFWLIETKNLTLYLEETAFDDWKLEPHPSIKIWSPGQEDKIDFIIVLGGDGTVLYVASLFQKEVPPIVSFNLGSLGFLTLNDYSEHQPVITKVLEGKVRLNLRMRLSCSIQPFGINSDKPSQFPVYQALNDIVIERGTSPFMTHLEMYVDGKKVTTVQADGLIISTPTGSTAYSLSAGGPIIHSSVPGILVTPICPHTLSFRPLFLPDSAEILILNSPSSRQTVSVSIDGRRSFDLISQSAVRICGSEWPVPVVCQNSPSDDMFQSLARCLQWNVREPQKPLFYYHEPTYEDDDNNMSTS